MVGVRGCGNLLADKISRVLEKGTQLFEAWSEKGTALNPSLRSVVYRAGVKANPVKAYEVLKKEWETTTSPDGKDFALAALGAIRDEDTIANKVIPFLFSTGTVSVPTADMHSLGMNLANNSAARPLLWKYLQENWAQACAKMANPIILDRFVKTSLSKFTDAKSLEELDAFFQDKDTSAFDRTLEQVKDAVRGRAAYRTRDANLLKEWLTANKYVF
jgi:aminopeptidase N